MTEGNMYSLVTQTVSSVQGYLEKGQIGIRVTLVNASGSGHTVDRRYKLNDVPVNYDLTGLHNSPKEITNLAFGMFLLDPAGYVSLTKSLRNALAKLIESYPGSIDLELKCGEVKVSYHGAKLLIHKQEETLTQQALGVLTRTFHHRHIVAQT